MREIARNQIAGRARKSSGGLSVSGPARSPAQGRIERHRDRSGEHGAEKCVHEVRSGGKDDRDAVAGRDPLLAQASCRPLRALVQFGEGKGRLPFLRVEKREPPTRPRRVLQGGVKRLVARCNRWTAGQHAAASSRRRSTRAASSATVWTATASSSFKATRKRSSRPTTSVSKPTESSWRSRTRSSLGR